MPDDNTESTTDKLVTTMLANPLFLPPGSVRALIGLILVTSTVYAWLTNPDNVPAGLLTLTASVAAFYYGTKK